MDLLEAKLKELGIMDKPECIYNCDETGFICAHGTKKVLCKRGCQSVHSIANDNEKTMFMDCVQHASCLRKRHSNNTRDKESRRTYGMTLRKRFGCN